MLEEFIDYYGVTGRVLSTRRCTLSSAAPREPVPYTQPRTRTLSVSRGVRTPWPNVVCLRDPEGIAVKESLLVRTTTMQAKLRGCQYATKDARVGSTQPRHVPPIDRSIRKSPREGKSAMLSSE